MCTIYVDVSPQVSVKFSNSHRLYHDTMPLKDCLCILNLRLVHRGGKGVANFLTFVGTKFYVLGSNQLVASSSTALKKRLTTWTGDREIAAYYDRVYDSWLLHFRS